MKSSVSVWQTIAVGGVVVLTMFSHIANAGNEIKWRGYLNAIAEISDSETQYLEAIDENGSFSSTNFGVNAAARISSKMSVAGQIHATTEAVELDWGYGQYLFNEHAAGKAGRIKYPAALVSETIDIGVLHLWIRAPESVYSESADLTFEAYNGAAFSYASGDEVELSSEFFVGEVGDEGEQHKKMFGVVVKAEAENYTIKLAGNTSTLFTVNPADPKNEKTRTIINFGAKAEYEIATIMFEYVSSKVEDNKGEDKEGWYITLAHPLESWTPHFTYQSFETVSGSAEQTSFTFGLNKFLAPSAVLKMEFQQVDPSNGGFFDSQPTDSKVNLINLSMNLMF